MIQSIWDITFDPDGTPLTLASAGDLLVEEPAIGAEQEVETVRFVEGEFAANYARSQKAAGWTLEVRQYHATLIAAAEFRLTRLAAIPWSTSAPLEMDSTDLGVTMRAANTVVKSCFITLPNVGRPCTLSKYVFLGEPFVNVP